MKPDDRPVLMGWSCMTRNGCRNGREIDDIDMKWFIPRGTFDEGGATFASDVYSLGKCFLSILDGFAIPDDIMEMIMAMVSDNPSSRPQIENVMGHRAFRGVPRDSECPEEDTLVSLAQNESECSVLGRGMT
jgi:hypothetical protein